VATVGEQESDLSEQSSVCELGSLARILEDTDSVHAKALRKSEDDSVEVILSLVDTRLGVDLVVRVDEFTRATVNKDIVGLDLAVEQPSRLDQARLESRDVLYIVAVRIGKAVKNIRRTHP
jgi:hypothetical protein